MKSSLVITALSGCALAFDLNSDAFRLFIKSDNSSIDGLTLGACHEGAAIEALCVYPGTSSDPPNYSTTFFHTTDFSSQPIDTPGILYWNLTSSDNTTYPSAMRFITDETSNVAMPLLMPGNSTYTSVYFDADGCLYIPWFFDDTVVPPRYLEPPEKLRNWFACVTDYAYEYTTLTWKVGVTGSPQNPTCQSVGVYREFIEG